MVYFSIVNWGDNYCHGLSLKVIFSLKKRELEMAKEKKLKRNKPPKSSDFQACADWIRDRYIEAQLDWVKAKDDLRDIKSFSYRKSRRKSNPMTKKRDQFVVEQKLMPSKRASKILMHDVYRLIRSYRRAGKMKKLEKFIVKRDGRPVNVQAWDNPYYLGFLLVFGLRSKEISNQNRSKYGQMLSYACLHEVPPRFLIGFLLQAGSYEVIRNKQKQNFIEEGFEKLVNNA